MWCLCVVVVADRCGVLSVLKSLVCFIYGGEYCITVVSRVCEWGPRISRLHSFVLKVLVGRDGCASRLPRRGECGVGDVLVGLAWGIKV